MSRVNYEGEIIITGKIKHRMIKYKVNSFLGGKFGRIESIHFAESSGLSC